MPRQTKSAKKGAEAEINRLRAQVRELQSELSGNDPNRRESAGRDEDDEPRPAKYRRAANEATTVATELPVRVMDEVAKLARGFTYAYLEQLRVAGDVLQTFADEVILRNRPQTSRSRSRSAGNGESEEYRRPTMTGLASSLPADLASGYFRALNRSLDIIGDSVDRFSEVYHETEEEAEPTLSRTRKSRSNELPVSPKRKSRASRSRRARSRKSPISAARGGSTEEKAAT